MNEQLQKKRKNTILRIIDSSYLNQTSLMKSVKMAQYYLISP